MRPQARSSTPLRSRRRTLLALALAAAALAAAGCGAVGRVTAGDGDAAAGKKLFVSTCGACHVLADAGTKGTAGPNLDWAFAADKDKPFASADTEQTIRDIVRGQIAYAEADPGTGTPGMPPNLLRGQQARDVAVYVAKCAAVPRCSVE
ncbi:MAG TPA: cytochrome c [Gaiellaceae bacterium]|nr:cytochrome c [Gaiellaceae bacterium]